MKSTDGLGGAPGEKALMDSTNDEWIEDWSKDGRYIAYGTNLPGGNGDLFALPTSGDRKPIPIATSASVDDEPRFSFDGKWIAYNSNQSGMQQVYLVSFPETNQRRQVTAGGGAQPRWRKDGRELYYLSLDGKMMAVDIAAGSAIDSGAPRMLFNTKLTVDSIRDQFAVTADGQRFLLQLPVAEAPPTPITVVLNWQAILGK